MGPVVLFVALFFVVLFVVLGIGQALMSGGDDD